MMRLRTREASYRSLVYGCIPAVILGLLAAFDPAFIAAAWLGCFLFACYGIAVIAHTALE